MDHSFINPVYAIYATHGEHNDSTKNNVFSTVLEYAAQQICNELNNKESAHYNEAIQALGYEIGKEPRDLLFNYEKLPLLLT